MEGQRHRPLIIPLTRVAFVYNGPKGMEQLELSPNPYMAAEISIKWTGRPRRRGAEDAKGMGKVLEEGSKTFINFSS